MQEDSWRGGFLLVALEKYLKFDMKSKMKFLRDMEAGDGFTSTMMTQEFEGSTTMVPQVRLSDFFKLFSGTQYIVVTLLTSSCWLLTSLALQTQRRMICHGTFKLAE
jgi:hypothetical protein